MADQLQEQKFAKLFERYDTDGDGRIDQTDIDALIQGWCNGYQVPPGSERWRAITQLANKLWQELEGHTDSNGDKEVALDEWHAAHDQAGFIDEVAIPLALAAFDLGDLDGDGQVSLNEWLTGQTISGLGQTEALELFQSLDVDGDGFVTKDEYAKAIQQFYTSGDEEAAGNMMAGSLQGP